MSESWVYSFLNAIQSNITADEIRSKDYSKVRANLEGGTDPDLPLDIDQVYVTGMEFCMFCEDWKMFLIFFLAGADVMENIFDGTIETFASHVGEGEPLTIPAFRNQEGDQQCIAGFHGLHCILEAVNDDPEGPDQERKRENMIKVLRLTEKLHNESISFDAGTITKVRNFFRQLNGNDSWEVQFNECIISTSLFLNRICDTENLPADIKRIIAGYLLPGILLDSIQTSFKNIVQNLGTDE